MKRYFYFFVALLCVLSLSSCTTTKTEYVTEYVEKEIDFPTLVDPVLELRPDNTQMVIKTDITCVFDIIDNSCEYQKAWELWQSYATSLEGTIDVLRAKYGPKTTN